MVRGRGDRPALAFRPTGQRDLAPSGTAAKLAANISALEILSTLEAERREPAAEEQQALARWAGWGSLPKLFDEADESWAEARERVRALLGDEQAWDRARRTTLNAHYTSAEVVKAMWGLAGELGFSEGEVLEPGCGSGNFLGFAPEGARLTGIELDPTTAAVARHLYGGRATLHTGSFEDHLAEEIGRFDLVIGNVPFAKLTPYDRHHNQGRHALHNYFLVKSLHLTRPGGLVVALTSRYTLDAGNPAARSEMADLADLVGAVRLPAGAFRQSSGTDVVTDLLVLRRREAGEARRGLAWLRTQPLEGVVEAYQAPAVNEVFAAHPELVAGRLAVTRGMYRDNELTVEPTGPLAEDVGACFAAVVQRARGSGLTLSPGPPVGPSLTPGVELPTSNAKDEGSFVYHPESGLGRVQGGRVQPYAPRVANDADELRRLIGLRDAARAALEVQLARGSDAELAEVQAQLSSHYQGYRQAFGPLNRFATVRTGRFDPDSRQESLGRRPPRMGGFRDDPDWPLVAALEIFDEETQSATPAAIFTQRIVDPAPPARGVDSAAEAVAVCLDESATVTTARAAELMGIAEVDARQALHSLVWEHPGVGELVPASRYLSGDVRTKLEEAEAAAASDPRWQANVDALAAVLPRQLEPGEIAAQLGAPWITTEDVEAFAAEVLETGIDVEHLPTVARWEVKLRVGSRASVALSSEWGTSRADGISLLGASLNQRLYTVSDEDQNGRRVRNVSETIAAREKQDALAGRFSTWVWEDPARATRLAGRYNQLFSSTVLPRHDGSHLSLPGLSSAFTPHAHQRDAVARVLTDGRALLAHAVGAGKTATMVMSVMEMRRLGLAAKPAVVVPNHMLEQFSREWLQLYPTARILVADRDRLSKAHRKEFVARCALGDWDAVVFSHSGFGRIPVGKDLQDQYLAIELADARVALGESRSGKALSVKRLERRIAQLEEKHKELLATHNKDDGVTFPETGIDYVLVDEAHVYKNRRVDSGIDGMSNQGSQRAEDLDAKLWALRQRHGQRVVTFATATPVANSMAELWTMQRYLQPDVLQRYQMGPFDAWAANFAKTVTAVELAPDGSSYRLQTRFARFQNVPDLLTMYRQVADVRTNEDLDMALPELVGNKPETVVVAPSRALVHYVAELAERAEQVRNRSVTPEEDNMLKITGDGRRAALDLRLVDLEADPHESTKLATAADRIAEIHAASRERRYVDASGAGAGRPGGLQLVFCDVSTPAAAGWNAYDELRELLMERGVPREQVRFVHEAKSDDAKARLFAACRDGRVAVLVGSSEKMGVGTNVQARALALHHLDCPWRPADIEQREGRLLRQGNQNAEVEILRYVTEASFDTYMWQTVERKAGFIAQVTTGRLVDREVDDIGDQALSFAEVKALATGNPLIVEKAEVDTEVARLVRLERSHHDDQHRLSRKAETAERRCDKAMVDATAVRLAIGRRRDTRGERFTMNVAGRDHIGREEAGRHLKAEGQQRLATTSDDTDGPDTEVASLGGLSLRMATTTRAMLPEVRLRVQGTPIEVHYGAPAWKEVDPIALVTGLERRIHNLDQTLANLVAGGDEARSEAARARARLGRTFEHGPRLRELRARQREITDTLMEATDASTPAPTSRSEAPVTGPSVPPPGDAVASDALSRLRRLAAQERPRPGMGLS